MHLKITSGLSLVVVLIFAPLSLALADYTITVTIGNTTLPAVTNGPVNIAGIYTHAATGGQITIADSGGTAQVLLPNAGQDNVLDSIKLVNARITANNPNVTNFPLSFQAQMTSGPDTPVNTVYYKINAVGVFQVALGSSFLIGDYLQNPLTEGYTFLQQQQFTPGNVAFNIAPPGASWPPPGHADLSGNRVLRVETAIKLANGRWLDFNTGANPSRFILMYSSPSPDQCDGAPDCQADVPSMYLPGLLKWSECHGKKGWFCRVFRIGCPELP
jgi:hypothetical protein